MRVKVDKVYTGEEILLGYGLTIWEVSLQDFDLTTLHHDLRMWEWEGNQPQGELRLAMGYTSPDSIYAFKNEFKSLKDDILDQLYETGSEHIKQHWNKGLEYYKNNSIMDCTIYKDLPGFSMVPHVDHGHIMFQLLINLTENDTGTAFHNPSTFSWHLLPTVFTGPVWGALMERLYGKDFFEKLSGSEIISNKYTDTPVYKSTGEQGKGIVFVNTPNSAHSITDITKDRYVIYATIGF